MGNKQSRGKRGQAKTPSPDPPQTLARNLTILHFNDVYNIENSDRDGYVSGAARLAGMVKALEGEKPLVLFSGDAFSPSSMSTITLGSHMPPVLNTIGINAACVGNHDFDLGLATAEALVGQCNFPWLFSNVRDKSTGEMLPGLLETLTLDHSGVRVGLMGLVESEWLQTLPALDPDMLEYRDFIQEGERLAAQLRGEGVDLVVAITHMRVPNDRLLAASVPGIDLVLGGHDHHYEVDFVEPHHTLMCKSGTDFRDLTRIDITLPPAGGHTKPTMTWQRLPITLDSPQHQPTVQAVAEFGAIMGAKMDEVIAYSLSELDSRFASVRLAESNMGNMVCDILRKTQGADIVIINSGTLRSDQIHSVGPFRLRDLVNLLPMPDLQVVLQATGKQVVEALENGVSQVPRLEGRFPQVSGVRFKYDSSLPPGARILPGSVQVLSKVVVPGSATTTLDGKAGPALDAHHPVHDACQHEEEWVPLKADALYRLSVKAYMAAGKDGYDVLEQCKVLVDEEEGLVLSQAVRNHFRSLKVLNMWDPKVKACAALRKWQGQTKAHSQSTTLLNATDDTDPMLVAALGPPRASKGQGAAGSAGHTSGTDSPQPTMPAARVTSCLPMRSRLVNRAVGICVLNPDHGYVINAVLEDRIVDVAAVKCDAVTDV